MIVQFQDSVTGTPVYINPAFVATFRPDPEDPERATDVKLRDGETLRVIGDHREVANKLTSLPQ
jgi:hypothetical protein